MFIIYICIYIKHFLVIVIQYNKIIEHFHMLNIIQNLADT
jgi:hypothetical protein